MTLALKYRPTQFQDLVGQRSVSQTLSYALDQKKISNAYLRPFSPQNFTTSLSVTMGYAYMHISFWLISFYLVHVFLLNFSMIQWSERKISKI